MKLQTLYGLADLTNTQKLLIAAGAGLVVGFIGYKMVRRKKRGLGYVRCY